MKKVLIKGLVCIFMVSSSIGLMPNMYTKKVQAIEIGSDNGQGLIEATKEDKEWFEKNSIEAGDIKNNNLALNRIKEEYGKESIKNYKNYDAGSQVIPKNNINLYTNETVEDILPTSVDNSKEKFFPPIGDQGSLQSCGSFVTTYYQMSSMFALKNGWDNKTNNNNVFSPKWTYNMASGVNWGTNFIRNFRILKDVGASSWNDFPYSGDANIPANYTEWCTNTEVWKKAAHHKVDIAGKLTIGSSKVGDYINSPNHNGLKKAKKFLNNGYILTYGTSSNFKFKFVKDNPNTDKDDKYINNWVIAETVSGGAHAMTIVGYNDNIWVDINNNGKMEESEMGAFKVANSWGDKWCEDGFAWLAYDSLNKVSAVPDFIGNSDRRESILEKTAYYLEVEDVKTPKLTVQFTIEHPNRTEISSIGLQARDSKDNIIKTKYLEGAFRMPNGEVPISGGLESKEVTFVVDYDNLLEEIYNVEDVVKWEILFEEDKPNETSLKIKDLKLLNQDYKVVATCNENLPDVVSGTEKKYSFNYKINTTTMTKPIISIDEMGIDNDGLFTIYFDGSQKDGRKVHYYLYENNKCIKTSEGKNWGIGKDIYGADIKENGEYIYNLMVKDQYGNFAVSESITVNVKVK